MNQQETKALYPNIKNLGNNTVINFISQAIVAMCAVIMVPQIVHGLGYSSYGLLTLALMVLGSFSLLELGLGRTTTKYVAQYLSTNEYDKISAVVWTSLIIQIFIGLICGVVLALFSTKLVSKINIQADMISEATKVIYILACSIPFILGNSTLRGTLEGAQRFDLVNYIKVMQNISIYLIPLIGAKYSYKVHVIVIYMLIVRLIATIAYFISCIHILPQLRKISAFNIQISTLLSYAGWVAVSNIIVPFLVQIDRYYIASFVSVPALTFYNIPFEIIYGLWIIPSSIVSVLFPAFSSANYNNTNLKDLFFRPIKYMLFILGPSVLIVIVFSHDILLLWQGADIAQNSYKVLQLLAFGVLINSLGWIPSNLVMGSGRSDIIAKIHLFQLVIYIIFAYYLIIFFGVVGASVAFAIRVSFESVLFFFAGLKLHPFLKKDIIPNNLNIFISLIVLYSILTSIKLFTINTISCYVISFTIICIYYCFIWKKMIDEKDRSVVLSLLNKRY